MFEIEVGKKILRSFVITKTVHEHFCCAELSRTNIPNVKNILSNLDSSDKSGNSKPRDNNLNALENSAKYSQGIFSSKETCSRDRLGCDVK